MIKPSSEGITDLDDLTEGQLVMPDNLVRELIQQNDMARDIITKSLSLEFPLSVC